jgi:hypothetical protein
MMVVVAVAGVVALAGGCSSEPEGDPVAEQSLGASPSAEDAGAEGGGEFVPEYASARELLDALQAGGVECDTEPGSEPAPTVASAEAWSCYTNEARDRFYGLDVFAAAEQQGEAMPYMVEVNPGTTFVVGTGWSVSLPFGSDGSEVIDAVGGQVYE